MHKQVIKSVFFTKEEFEQQALKVREEKAKAFGLTLEEWDRAVIEGKVLTPPSESGDWAKFFA